MLLAVVVSAVVAAGAPMGIDYRAQPHPYDSARPQIDALIRLDLGDFAANQVPQGPVSMVVRAPFAAFASAGDQLSRYRLGVFACVLALALVAVLAAAAMRRRGSPLWHCVLVAAVIVFTPAAHQTIVWGHPEEMLATALVVGAALAVAGDRRRLAFVLAGLAIATKPWALIALPALALMASGGVAGRSAARFAVAGVAVAALAIGPVAVANTDAFHKASDAGNWVGPVFPMSVWWFTSDRHVTTDLGGGETRRVRRPAIPQFVEDTIRPAIIAIGFGLSLVLLGRRRPSLADAFGVLALLFLLRCLLEPHDHVYYHVPFIAAVALAEGFARRPPVIALVASVLLSNQVLRQVNSNLDHLALLYLAWAVPVCVLLGTRLRGRRVGTA